MKEKIAQWFAWHMPKGIAYWCSVRLATGNGLGGPYALNPGERNCSDVLKAHEGWRP